jgi:SMC interacting uncharacterized protein involved in chromosome segregation
MVEEPDKRNINGSYQWGRGSSERIRRLENKVNGVDAAEGRLEVGQATRQEQITALKEECVGINHDVDENSKQIELLRDRIDDALTATSHKFEEALAATNKKFDYALGASNKKFEDALVATNKKFDDALLATNTKFDENKNYFNRWFIGLLATLLTSVILIVLTQVVHLK